MVNPWRASSNGDNPPRHQFHTTNMSPSTQTYTKPSVENHPDREHEILMTNIALYAHINKKMVFGGGLQRCEKCGERNVNNLQGGNTPLYINTLLSP